MMKKSKIYAIFAATAFAGTASLISQGWFVCSGLTCVAGARFVFMAFNASAQSAHRDQNPSIQTTPLSINGQNLISIGHSTKNPGGCLDKTI